MVEQSETVPKPMFKQLGCGIAGECLCGMCKTLNSVSTHPPTSKGWHDFSKHISMSFPLDTRLEGMMTFKFVTYILRLKSHF